ncbi:MAG: hypothetical protein ACRD8W_29050, partial [Nitrososphaeraceae archaeon]
FSISVYFYSVLHSVGKQFFFYFITHCMHAYGVASFFTIQNPAFAGILSGIIFGVAFLSVARTLQKVVLPENI